MHRFEVHVAVGDVCVGAQPQDSDKEAGGLYT